MKWIRIVLSVVLLLVVVAVVAIGSLMIFIDPNKLKPGIAAEIKKQTGYEVVMQGDFAWSFYPSIGVKVERVALFMPKQTQPFVDLRGVTFVMPLAQLLQGRQTLAGDVYIAEAKLLNLNAQHVRVGIRWQDQVLTLAPFTANLYEGSLSGSLRGRNLFNLPQWQGDFSLSNIQMRAMMDDLSGPDSKLKMSGLSQVTLHVMMQGKTREQILGSLNGAATFNVTSGVIDGFDLNYLLRSADALMNKQPVLAPTGPNQTTFDSLTGTMAIKNGVMVTNDIALTAPALLVNGAGSINLPFQAINFQLRLAAQREARTQWVIPVMITGNMYRPDVRLDVTELNILLAKEKLDKLRSKVRDQVKEHVTGKAGDILQNLLK